NGFDPVDLLRRIDRLTCDEDLWVVAGVGNSQTWAARHLTFSHPTRRLLASGAQGSMGYDLPSAIGAAFQQQDSTILCVTSDQSLQANLHELSTLVRYNLPVKILLLDNRPIGDLEADTSTNAASTPTLEELNFQELAGAYGVPWYELSTSDEDLDGTLRRALSEKGPGLFYVRIDTGCSPTPQVARDEALEVMWMR
ncbi:MAG: hypothetical protein JRC77_08980, partial [Deltaproteobacteria bacterium]|nr:hypothetical protein [Deltaproteobacteria bacterium]